MRGDFCCLPTSLKLKHCMIAPSDTRAPAEYWHIEPVPGSVSADAFDKHLWFVESVLSRTCGITSTGMTGGAVSPAISNYVYFGQLRGLKLELLRGMRDSKQMLVGPMYRSSANNAVTKQPLRRHARYIPGATTLANRVCDSAGIIESPTLSSCRKRVS